jgi:hypothetical protein
MLRKPGLAGRAPAVLLITAASGVVGLLALVAGGLAASLVPVQTLAVVAMFLVASVVTAIGAAIADSVVEHILTSRSGFGKEDES